MSFVMKATGGACAADRDEVRRALSALIDPGQTFELRGLPSGRSRTCRGSDLDGAVLAAYDLSDGQVYYTLNPCRADLDKPAANRDITSRRWLPIDCDPIRPVDVSATDAEKGAAIDLAALVADHLSSVGWPDPVWVDSGNGVHLLYRIDLPADKLSQQLVKGVLVALADKFDGPGAHVDRAMHNAARIAKLPGTWARKGPQSDDRPHRMARLVSAPPMPEVVPVELLQALVEPPAKPAVNGHPAWAATTTATSLDGYVRSAVGRECTRVAMTPAGDRNNALNTAAFNLGTMAGWPEMLLIPARAELLAAALHAGLGDLESRKTIESGWTAGAAKGRARPVSPQANGAPKAMPGGRLIILASEVIPRKVEWLWPDRIPIGKLTTFAGWGGLGKSFVTMDLAARISRGNEIPGAKGECFERGNVLILNTEDDPDDTSVPRLIEAGADLRRIAFAKSEILGQFTLGDLDTLDKMLGQLGGARLLVIDPATAHLGNANDHKNAELRGLLMPLSLWAMDRRLAVILVTHVNKPSAGKVEAMARVVGSVAWVNAVRAAVMFAKDPNDKTQRLFVPFKSNNAPERKGLAYRLVSTEVLAKIEWLAEVDTSADDAINRVERKKVGESAVEWVTARFRERREWASKELRKLAKEAGISTDALFKGDEVQALPITKRPFSGSWVWFAQNGWPIRESESSESSESPAVTPFRERLDQLSDQLSDSLPKEMGSESQLSELSGDSELSDRGCEPESCPDPGRRPTDWPEGDAWIHTKGGKK